MGVFLNYFNSSNPYNNVYTNTSTNSIKLGKNITNSFSSNP